MRAAPLPLEYVDFMDCYGSEQVVDDEKDRNGEEATRVLGFL